MKNKKPEIFGRKSYVIAALALAVSGVISLSKSHSPSGLYKTAAALFDNDEAAGLPVKQETSLNRQEGRTERADGTGVPTSASESPQAAENSGSVRLQEYAFLRSKVLLRDEERVRKQELLEDPEFLRQVGDYLRGKSDMGNLSNERHAVDLLMEALRYSESGVADQILHAIVADPQIEHSDLSLAQRERLAETKAEIMYLWSSADAKLIQMMPQILPGEVSQKLWSNVRSLQQQNAVESVEVAKRFAATGNHMNAVGGPDGSISGD